MNMISTSSMPIDYSNWTSEPLLTFGVELEFVVPMLPEGVEDEGKLFDSRQVYGLTAGQEEHSREAIRYLQTHIANTLKAHGVRPWPATEERGPDVRLSHWIVDIDTTVKVPNEKFQWYGVEVQSPPLYTTKESTEQVKKVAEILKNSYRTNTNRPYSLHVHVGDGYNGFPVQQLRKLTALLWVFEPQLSQCHPSHRLTNGHCGSLWENTILGGQQIQAGKTTRREGLESIPKAETSAQISDLVSHRPTLGRTAYWFGNLIPGQNVNYYDDIKRTVEFRQHEGTLNAERIEHWVRVCIWLVRYAREMPQFEIEDLCRENANRSLGEYSIKELPTELGQEDDARYYHERLRQGLIEPDEEEGALFLILPTLDYWDGSVEEREVSFA
jgi:hypothetical protein